MPPVLCPFEANQDEPIRERYGYRTDVLASHTRREQRRKLKRHPTGGLEYSIFCSDQRDPALANGLLLQDQGALWGVPLWPYATRLGGNIPINSGILIVTTTNFPFQDVQGFGQYVLLWSDSRTWSLHLVDVVGPASITLLDVTTRAWNANSTWVIPVRTGYLEQLLPLSWQASKAFSARLRFSFDAAVDAAAVLTPPAAAVTYQGYEVLEKDPDGEDAAADSLERRMSLLGTIGARSMVTLDTRGAISRPFRWKCQTLAELATLRSFLDRRMGRLNAVWIPSGEMDLVPTATIGSGATTFSINFANYTAGMFPSVGSRRHLCFIPVRAAGTRVYRKVTNAVDNGDGTETLTIDSSPGQSIDPSSWVVCFNRLCRQAEDEVQHSHFGNHVTDTTIPFVEVPLEAPL